MFTTYDLQQFLDGIFTLFTWVYWGTMLLMLAIFVPMVFKKGKSQSRKILNVIGTSAGIIVLFVRIIPMLLMMALGPSKAERQEAEEWQRKYQAAEAVFKQQCEKAGEKIYRTVDNVEGIMLLKVVPKSNYSSADAQARDPMWAEAALQQSAYDTEFIELFLENGDKKFYYKYIDVLQNTDNQKVIRYSGKKNHMYENGTPKYPARYAVNYELDVNPELRKHWVAGATIQIIDRQQNEIIAEKTWFVFEKGLGSKGGGRMPWLFAVACYSPNSLAEYLGYENKMDEYFVPKILTPKQETQNVK